MDRGFVFKNISAYVEQFGPGDSKVKYVYTNQTGQILASLSLSDSYVEDFFSTFN